MVDAPSKVGEAPPALFGRRAERERLERLVATVQAGGSDVLAVRGAPGVGKSSLLGFARTAAAAREVRTITVHGLESEVEIAFAGLLELLRPLRSHLPLVPRHLAGALEAALALGPPAAGDPLAVGVGTLTLLASAAEDRPLLIGVDDLQWIDGASRQALMFAARRLGDDGVGILLAFRSGAEREIDVEGFDSLEVEPLDPQSARSLAEHELGPGAAPHLPELVCAQSAGNPLAIVELVGCLDEAQREGRAAPDWPLKPGGKVEAIFRRRIEALDAAAREALLVTAASDEHDVNLIARAVEAAGERREDLEAAEAAGLIRVAGGRLEFTHPLIRNVVYHTAAPDDRRRAHRALAVVLEAELPDLAVWQYAMASARPDESVAASLEGLAVRASARGGSLAATRALERAAELSPSRVNRARRLVLAAAAAGKAGDLPHSLALARRVLEESSDEKMRAEAQLLAGTATGVMGSVRTGMDLLVAEANAARVHAPEAAVRMLLQASTFAEMRAELNRALELATAAHELAVAACASQAPLAGVGRWRAAARVGGGRRSLTALEQLRPVVEDSSDVRCRCGLGEALFWLERSEDAAEVLDAAIRDVRGGVGRGVTALPYLLAIQSQIRLMLGDIFGAQASAADAARLALDTRQRAIRAFSLVCQARTEALQGAAEVCRQHLDEAQSLTPRTDAGALWIYLRSATGLLELSCGDPKAAISALEEVALLATAAGLEEPNVLLWEPDLIEAHVRAGQDDAARHQLRSLDRRVRQTGGVGSAAVAARCAGLVAPEDAFDARFERALILHAERPMPFEGARTELCWGERLRRAGRRRDAREHLRNAHAAFERMGAHAWSARARVELMAAGGSAKRTPPDATARLAELTPHELSVALTVASGASNAETAAALFLSVKTIEKHLTSAYRKLGVRSRAQLAALIATHHQE